MKRKLNLLDLIDDRYIISFEYKKARGKNKRVLKELYILIDGLEGQYDTSAYKLPFKERIIERLFALSLLSNISNDRLLDISYDLYDDAYDGGFFDGFVKS